MAATAYPLFSATKRIGSCAQSGDVHRLVETAAISLGLAEHAYDSGLAPVQDDLLCESEGDPELAAEHAIAADDPAFGSGHVHDAAVPARCAARVHEQISGIARPA